MASTPLPGIFFTANATQARLVAMQANEEAASVWLTWMIRGSHAEEIEEEITRRAEVFAAVWAARPDPLPPDETPRCAALLSVAEDVARGRIG